MQLHGGIRNQPPVGDAAGEGELVWQYVNLVRKITQL